MNYKKKYLKYKLKYLNIKKFYGGSHPTKKIKIDEVQHPTNIPIPISPLLINPEPPINKNDLPIISNRQPKDVHRPIPVKPLDLEQKKRRLEYLIDLNNLTNLSEKDKETELAPEGIHGLFRQLTPGVTQREINRGVKRPEDREAGPLEL
tara:strand:+ start:705 stop:1154 length:450 start_codon:yes stop_codon:yes gene_type:complete